MLNKEWLHGATRRATAPDECHSFSLIMCMHATAEDSSALAQSVHPILDIGAPVVVSFVGAFCCATLELIIFLFPSGFRFGKASGCCYDPDRCRTLILLQIHQRLSVDGFLFAPSHQRKDRHFLHMQQLSLLGFFGSLHVGSMELFIWYTLELLSEAAYPSVKLLSGCLHSGL